MKSSKRPSKYHFCNNFLAKNIPHFYHRKNQNKNISVVQNSNFSVIIKYHLSINFLPRKRPYFPFAKCPKIRTFQRSLIIIFPSMFWLKQDLICHLQKIQNENVLVISNMMFHAKQNIILLFF